MRKLFAIALIALAGCGTHFAKSFARGAGVLVPGYGVSDSMAVRACGSLPEFNSRVEHVTDKVREDGYNPNHAATVPAPGWPMCDVLAALGAPDDMNLVASGSGEELHLFYETGQYEAYDKDFHLVVVGADETVSFVNW